MIYHSIDKFSFDQEAQTFETEVSSLKKPFYGNIYNNTTDVGFALTLENPNHVAKFYLDVVAQSGEGEPLFWTFKPTPETIKQFSQFECIKVIVYND